jgi:hypothetical protein
VAIASDLIVKGAILRAVRGIVPLRYYPVNITGIHLPEACRFFTAVPLPRHFLQVFISGELNLFVSDLLIADDLRRDSSQVPIPKRMPKGAEKQVPPQKLPGPKLRASLVSLPRDDRRMDATIFLQVLILGSFKS